MRAGLLGKLVMLSEIKTKEIMTTSAAIEKYRKKYFIMIITEVLDQCDNDYLTQKK